MLTSEPRPPISVNVTLFGNRVLADVIKGKILDYVIAMDAKTEAEMEMKMRMMDRIDLFLNTISTTMMNLL